MSWAVGQDHRWDRWIGYGVPAWCDQPGCDQRIDRGLSHVCGAEPYGGNHGCGLFFCGAHLKGEPQRCERCHGGLEPFPPKSEHPAWVSHVVNDPSWIRWRAENPADLAALKARMGGP